MITWSYNSILRIIITIIIFLFANKWQLLHKNNYLTPYKYVYKLIVLHMNIWIYTIVCKIFLSYTYTNLNMTAQWARFPDLEITLQRLSCRQLINQNAFYIDSFTLNKDANDNTWSFVYFKIQRKSRNLSARPLWMQKWEKFKFNASSKNSSIPSEFPFCGCRGHWLWPCLSKARWPEAKKFFYNGSHLLNFV